MAKQKYYVVWDGHNPGVYSDWKSCQQQIKNYPGAKYKAFKTRAEADEALLAGPFEYIGKDKKNVVKSPKLFKDAGIIWDSLSVDAACSGNPGLMEYRGVDTKTGMEFFRKGPFQQGTNNLGEFLALVHGIALLKQQGRNIPIYSDSKIAMGWVAKKNVRTSLKRNSRNEQLFVFVDRALKWLKTNDYDTKIMKWDTANWGEIPADFGRK